MSETLLSLSDIGDEFLALDELAAMDDGEWTTEHEELANRLAETAALKADAFGAFVNEKQARIDVIAAEIERLTARKKALQNRVEWMKRYATSVLVRIERPKIEGDLYTLAVQKNPPSVQVTVMPDALPPEFVRVIPEQREPDRKALLAALKSGAVIPGAELAPTTYHLRIR